MRTKKKAERKLHDSPEARGLREAAVAWTTGWRDEPPGLNDYLGEKRDKRLLDAALAYAAAVRNAEDRLVRKVPSNACPARTPRCKSQDGAYMVLSDAKSAHEDRWCAYCGRIAELTPAETVAKARLIRRGRLGHT